MIIYYLFEKNQFVSSFTNGSVLNGHGTTEPRRADTTKGECKKNEIAAFHSARKQADKVENGKK